MSSRNQERKNSELFRDALPQMSEGMMMKMDGVLALFIRKTLALQNSQYEKSCLFKWGRPLKFSFTNDKYAKTIQK
jgi:hypothetical protein